jgi:hypothetical protein
VKVTYGGVKGYNDDQWSGANNGHHFMALGYDTVYWKVVD